MIYKMRKNWEACSVQQMHLKINSSANAFCLLLIAVLSDLFVSQNVFFFLEVHYKVWISPHVIIKKSNVESVNKCTFLLVLLFSFFTFEFFLCDGDDWLFSVVSVKWYSAALTPVHHVLVNNSRCLHPLSFFPLLVLPQVWLSVQSCAGSSVDRLAGGRFLGQKWPCSTTLA